MSQINNDFYEELQERWMHASDHPIALLRAENALRNPWISSHVQEGADVLDIGCGAGLFTNFLMRQKPCRVTGIDQAVGALAVAKKFDGTNSVNYVRAAAEALPFESESFDIVCAMDLLEHVQDPSLVIAEASRVLRQGGKFFFHTFNRNLLSYLLIIKAVETFIANTPQNLHLHSMFIKPKELNAILRAHALTTIECKGLRPVIFQKAWGEILRAKTIPEGFRFCFVPSLATGYCGFARKASKEPSK